jgi:hypothetical protein
VAELGAVRSERGGVRIAAVVPLEMPTREPIRMDESTRSYWATWHDDYDDPASDLSQRLIAVQRHLTSAIDRARLGPVRVISACAGQGHDVVGVMASHPRASDVQALLVESDDHNVRIARDRIAAAGITGVDVLQADAGLTSTYRAAVPADVLMLCGIFGNVSDEDVQRTVSNASRLCAPRATVLWTRRRRHPDRTPEIRGWFAEAGYEELAFDSPGPDRFAVGTLRLVARPLPYRSGLRLFTFWDE